MKLVKLNGQSIKIPQSWTEIPFNRFLKFSNLTKTFKTKEEMDEEYKNEEETKEYRITLDNLKANTKIAAFWTGLSEDEISMCDIDEINELMTDLTFMTQTYVPININSFKFKEEEYFVPNTGMRENTFGDYIEAEQVEINNKDLELGKLESLPMQVAILCKRKEELGKNLKDNIVLERAELFKELDMATLWDVGFFLTKHETRLLSSTLMYLKQEKRQQQKKSPLKKQSEVTDG
tara:strand:- start:31 stop:735 length:705 start_codon:yes stop_codon:yes gene_type:complete